MRELSRLEAADARRAATTNHQAATRHQRAGNAAIAGAVQRLMVGPSDSLDTTRPEDKERVRAWIQGLGDTQPLADLLTRLQATGHPLDARHARWIVREQWRARAMGTVTRRRREGGIWTQAILFVDGEFKFASKVIHGGSGGGWLQHVDIPKRYGGKPEQTVSQKDSEVGTLSEVLGVLHLHAVGANRIRVVLAGNAGPCDGCKSRIEQFMHRVRELLRKSQLPVKVEADYRDHIRQTRKFKGTLVETYYGYRPHPETKRSLGVEHYRKMLVLPPKP